MAEATTARVAAVLLAAGTSTRFVGGNKLLAEVAGRPLIAWTAAAFMASRADEMIVVTGPEPQAVASALSGLHVRFVQNLDHLSGMGSSIAVGVTALSGDPTGVLICPGDMPGVTPELIDHLIAAFEERGCDRIVRPVLPDERPGHPVLWPRRFFSRLARLTGPEGGRVLLRQLAGDIDLLPCSDPAAALDIDTTEDLERYRLTKRDMHNR